MTPRRNRSRAAGVKHCKTCLLARLLFCSPEHLSLVATTVKVIELYIDFSQSASTVFRDLNGLQEMIKRLAYEVCAHAHARV